MSPIADDATGLELMWILGLPAVLVGGTYLGGVSHILTALEVSRGHGVPVRAIVVSESDDLAAPDFAETVADVRRYGGGVEVVAAPRDLNSGWPQAVLSLVR